MSLETQAIFYAFIGVRAKLGKVDAKPRRVRAKNPIVRAKPHRVDAKLFCEPPSDYNTPTKNPRHHKMARVFS